MDRRQAFRIGLWGLRGLIGMVVAVPAISYILTPLFARRRKDSVYVPVARLSDLVEGVPRAFPVSLERQDAWVKYPPEPIGTVWLIRQSADPAHPVRALSAECPHLACQIKLSPDQHNFLCPCHDSRFELSGARVNKISPRGMDELEVEPFETGNADPLVRVKFERFRTMTPEKIPLG
jgi:quinol---cytochrome c reductase iron-sulfur subunit, bacillus type